MLIANRIKKALGEIQEFWAQCLVKEKMGALVTPWNLGTLYLQVGCMFYYSYHFSGELKICLARGCYLL